MQFKVPQFLDIEDKIFGPFTFKEFVYLVGGAGLCFIIYKLLGIFLGGIPILIVAAFSIALARYRPNNKPFINMIESAFIYLTQSKLYIWERRKIKIDKEKKAEEEKKNAYKTRERLESEAKLGGNKLRDLAWSLDVLDLNKNKDSL